MLLRSIVFLVALLPLPLVLWQSGEGPDPGKTVVLLTGLWTIRFLIITLSISPARQWLGFAALHRYRRMMGLYTWFYASLHLMAVLTYILGWSWAVFAEEFIERPYMALGISAWLLLVPLGLTSNRWMIKKLGRRWKQLHRLVYGVAILACGHFIWLIRSDYGEAMTYSVLIMLLLLVRLPLLRRLRGVTAA